MTSYLKGSIDLVGGILTERFGKRSKLFNDPITTLQICQHILKVGIERSERLHPDKRVALQFGKEIFQALNLYSSGHQSQARVQVESVIEDIARTETFIKWPDTVKKAYAKFTKNFPGTFEKGNQVQAQSAIDALHTGLEKDQDNPHVFALSDILQDLQTAVGTWDPDKIEDAFYSMVDYYRHDPTLEEPNLEST